MAYKLQGNPVPRVGKVGRPSKNPKPHNPKVTAGVRQRAANAAVAAVRNALGSSGMTSAQALHYAKILLTQKGVHIEPGGKILYKGKQFQPDAFASSNLAKFVTGAQAKAINQKAITTDPGYLQALASLGLARQDAISPLEDSRRQALIQFGDPGFVQNDPATAGAAYANPFSTVALESLQHHRDIQNVNENANRFGTYYGGGQISGQRENERVYTGRMQDATIKLQNLLNQINQQVGSANQAYNVGQSGAQLDAYNNLLSSGAIHAARPPALNVGQFNYQGFAPNPVAHPGPILPPRQVIPRPNGGQM